MTSNWTSRNYAGALADDYTGMQALLAPWLPDSDWMKWPPQQRATGSRRN